MKPLCVDLDGTLVRSDTLFEVFFKGLKENPLRTIKALLLLKEGRAKFKYGLAKLIEFDASELPLHSEIVSFVESQPKEREIVLATGAHRIIADRVAVHTGLFDKVIASDSQINLTGEKKLEYLVEAYGHNGFDYIGNDRIDWPVLEAADGKYIVASEGEFLTESQSRFKDLKVFVAEKPLTHDWLHLLRVHQWTKNFLLFIPFFLEHRLFDPMAWITMLGCFIAFSFVASATYIVNDLLDLRSDRANATKSKRPLPAGKISIPQAVKVAVCLMVASVTLLFFLPVQFIVVLALYLVSTLLYSFYLKSRLYVDILSLAVLHSLRIVAGTVAISAEWSFWLLAFSMFFFLSLATAKRVAELENLKAKGLKHIKDRDYTVLDIPLLVSSGVSSGYASVMIVALYINSEKVVRMYESPQILWLLCPLLLYWTGRIWFIASRGQLHEDPIVFALRDRISFYVLLLCAAAVVAAVLGFGG